MMNYAQYINSSSGGSYMETVEVLDRRPWTKSDKTQLERTFGFLGGKQPKWMYLIVTEGEQEWVRDTSLKLPVFAGPV
jgi:hypothetical protein